MDSTTESIVNTSGPWLDGFLEVDPYATIAVVSVTVLGVAYLLWRRFRGRIGQPVRRIP